MRATSERIVQAETERASAQFLRAIRPSSLDLFVGVPLNGRAKEKNKKTQKKTGKKEGGRRKRKTFLTRPVTLVMERVALRTRWAICPPAVEGNLPSGVLAQSGRRHALKGVS